MTNEELLEAITMANAMVKSAGQDSPRYPMLLTHLQELLREQQRRAQSSPVATPAFPHWVQPVIVHPTFVPLPAWELPWTVTC